MPVGGVTRTWLLQKPLDAQPDEELPVAIVIHGAGTDAQGVRDFVGEELVGEKRFIAVYPEGKDYTWNLENGCCWPAAQNNVDDMRFLSALISNLVTRADVDPDRISMSGVSLGGMVAYKYACEDGDRLSAIASVAGTHVTTCGPNEPVPTMQIHSLADEVVAYNGGYTPAESLMGMNFPPVIPMMKAWALAGDCPGGLVESEYPLLEHATATEWDCNGIITRLDTLTWGGHAWPGVGSYRVSDRMLDFLLQY
jgi:polyhydroxybutyrate depolymerase